MIQAFQTLCFTISAILVSQALMAAETVESPSTQVWTFQNQEHGWTAYAHCKLSVKDSLLQVDSTGKDPHFGRDVKSANR